MLVLSFQCQPLERPWPLLALSLSQCQPLERPWLHQVSEAAAGAAEEAVPCGALAAAAAGAAGALGTDEAGASPSASDSDDDVDKDRITQHLLCGSRRTLSK